MNKIRKHGPVKVTSVRGRAKVWPPARTTGKDSSPSSPKPEKKPASSAAAPQPPAPAANPSVQTVTVTSSAPLTGGSGPGTKTQP